VIPPSVTLEEVLLGAAAVCFAIAFAALLVAPLHDVRAASSRLRAERDRRREGLDHDQVAEALYPGSAFRRRGGARQWRGDGS
jgi:hypothetical protein